MVLLDDSCNEKSTIFEIFEVFNMTFFKLVKYNIFIINLEVNYTVKTDGLQDICLGCAARDVFFKIIL